MGSRWFPAGKSVLDSEHPCPRILARRHFPAAALGEFSRKRNGAAYAFSDPGTSFARNFPPKQPSGAGGNLPILPLGRTPDRTVRWAGRGGQARHLASVPGTAASLPGQDLPSRVFHPRPVLTGWDFDSEKAVPNLLAES